MKRAVAVILAMLCANSPAMELTMSRTEHAQCAREGGCTVISQRMLDRLLMQSRRLGMETCESEL